MPPTLHGSPTPNAANRQNIALRAIALPIRGKHRSLCRRMAAADRTVNVPAACGYGRSTHDAPTNAGRGTPEADESAHMFPGKPIQRRDLALAPNRPNIKNRIVDAVAGLVKTIPRGTLRLHETLFHTHIRLGHIAIRLVDRLQTTGLDILAKPWC